MKKVLVVCITLCALLLTIFGEGAVCPVKAADMAESLDLSGYSFLVSDVRNLDDSVSFNGADGRQAIIMFGNVSTCFNTSSVLESLNSLVSRVDRTQLNIYVFDRSGTANDILVSDLERIGISDEIVVAGNSNKYDSLYRACIAATVGNGNSYTYPLIIYKGTDGRVYSYTTGYHRYDSIAEYVEAGGVEVMPASNMTEIQVTGTYHQTEVRTMLNMINELRTGDDAWYWNEDNETKTTLSNLNELTYDYNLEQIAMQRAMEIAVAYSHVRPNGTSCWTAGYHGTESYGENIAAGYESVEAVFDGWGEVDEYYQGQGHRRNMLNEDFTAVGVACVYYNGYYYWVQEFGITQSGAAKTEANDSKTTVSVEVLKSNIESCELSEDKTGYILSCGDSVTLPTFTATMDIAGNWPGQRVTAVVPISWKSGDDSVASVSGNVLSATGQGSTSLTGTFIEPYTVSISVSVSEFADLIRQLEDAGNGAVVKTELSRVTVLPSEVFKAMRGKNVTLLVVLADGAVWSINGKEISNIGIKDVDLSVTKTTRVAGNIPSDTITSLAGSRDAEQLIFGQNGAFDFTGQLTLGMTSGITGNKGVLLQPSSADGTLTYVDSALIADNNITFNVSRGADSAVIYGTNGDTNGDNQVNIKDLMQILYHVSARTTMNEAQKGFADVDMNNSVNIQDLMRELYYVSGRNSTL